jgi:hypothetical protein
MSPRPARSAAKRPNLKPASCISRSIIWHITPGSRTRRPSQQRQNEGVRWSLSKSVTRFVPMIAIIRRQDRFDDWKEVCESFDNRIRLRVLGA